MTHSIGKLDTAPTTSNDSPDLITDGPCLQKTISRLDLPDEAIGEVREQAIILLSDVASAYTKEFGPVSPELNTSGAETTRSTGFGPTGLLYGRIQSGKTAAMITFTALALDNGFRIVVVMTTNFVELVSQTADRFGAVARALVHASTERGAWESDVENIKKHVGKRGLVIVCAKDARHLESVRKLVDEIGGSNYPAIILDDEADQASLDNNVRKRSRSKSKEEVAPTKIHDRIADVRRALAHHVFVQVTATPYALLLQNVDNPMRPRFTRLLEPGDGYTGGEQFFSESQLRFEEESPAPPIVYVDERESEDLQGSAPGSAPPKGFEEAIAFFLVASAAQMITDPQTAKKSQNFLCHTSHRKADHEKLDKLLRSFLSDFEDQLDTQRGRATALVHWGSEELAKTVSDIPPIDEIVDDIIDRLPRRRIRVINSEGKGPGELAGAPNFIIGGNIVGRGLTIPNLLVTYYLRKPKISQMDTMLQHARMFGYRERLMPLTRVFLPRSLAIRFHSIHRAEEDLRERLPRADALSSIPVQVVGQLRATRYGVLDTGSVVSLEGGKHVFPSLPPYAIARSRHRRINQLFEQVFGEKPETQTSIDARNAARVTVAVGAELCHLFRSDYWDGEALARILESTWSDILLRFRPMNRLGKDEYMPTGALSGSEREDARNADIPTFFLFRQVTKRPVWENRQFWYPTLVFPSKMHSVIYNDTTELEA